MKKTLSIVLAMLMAFAMSACNTGGGEGDVQTNTPTQGDNGNQDNGNSNAGNNNNQNNQGDNNQGDNNQDGSTTVGVPLLTPQLTRNENVVSWGLIDNAVGYIYKIGLDGNEIFTPVAFVTLKDGETLYVRALGDGEKYTESAWSAPITYIASKDDDNQTDDNNPTDDNQGETPSTPTEITRQTYGSYWTPQTDYMTMPIGAYNGLPPEDSGYYQDVYSLNYDQVLRDYNELGVNFLFGLYNSSNLNLATEKTTLELCEKYNIGFLSKWSEAHFETVSSLTSTDKASLEELMAYESFMGLIMVDEPGYKAFSHMATAKDTFVEAIGEKADNYLYHANLLPNWTGVDPLYNYQAGQYAEKDWDIYKNYTYAQYLSDYMRIYQPQVLSYDFYPMVGEGAMLKDGYFENLSVIRKTALEANIPFWTFVQTCAWSVGQRLPSQGELLWNVNTCLAYGAKGIEYFCGVEPWNSSPQEHFNGSLFYKDGSHVDTVYDSAKIANKQIQAIDDVLMCSKNEGVIFVGKMPALADGTTNRMTKSTGDVLERYKELTSVSAHHAVVGCFDYNGKSAFYVVNNSTTSAGSVILQFNNKGVDGYTIRNAVKNEFSGDTLQFDLGVGEGVLVVLN